MSVFNRDKNRAVWFDIPVVDLDRAVSFYQAVLGVNLDIETFANERFAVISHDEGNGGCLIVRPEEVSASGLLVYLNVHGRIRDAVRQTSEHGGKVIEEVHSIGPHGYRAIVRDSEGNRIALHSDNNA